MTQRSAAPLASRRRPALARPALRLVALGVVAATLTGCNAMQRLSEVGEPPKMSTIENPVESASYRPVSMPMPTPQRAEPSVNSLWRPGARAFFEDQRADEVGDILTVVVNIQNERANLSNATSRSRDANESAGLPGLLGFESRLGAILPDEVDPANLIGAESESGSTGTGTIRRSETVDVKLAAVVLQKLPNGNLVVAGRQEVRVNNELRELAVTGVVRPQDISSANTITVDKIAEARISYGGRGTISDVQQPRYGQQIFDIIFPF
ncbi:flagellar basal body L-ring protein FlgH [Caenispirillum bisanense]|uniref:Flagellar L-ring protein n=1 Tax=Caenispirillum bisanense TaxID=414052 RepID=A0A286GX95_9PROT|nr:flagellar basal body L-ring protein FlgH [Caenispirillum bisanense]SOE00158.1 flagellar L-ring protein precursor FlgH [Caenispirillum bisanense]